MGYHLGALTEHFFHSRRSDFIEMALHHFLSLYLYGGSYLCNAWECAGVIAFLHDTAAITTDLTKLLTETKYKWATATVFFFHLGLWSYTRMYVYPILIYELSNYTPDMESQVLRPIFVYLLSGLCVLHFYWFYIKMLILHGFCTKGSTEDI